jgi:hypothetical protein
LSLNISTVDAYTIIPSLLNGLARVANNTDPLKIHYSAISYKPFISLFNLTAADPINHPVTPFGNDKGGLVDYASAVVLEVYDDNSLKMLYKNGTKNFVEVPLNSSLNTVGGFTHALAVSFSISLSIFCLCIDRRFISLSVSTIPSNGATPVGITSIVAVLPSSAAPPLPTHPTSSPFPVARRL